MGLQAKIDESKIDNFSKDAKTTLVSQIEKYGEDIIKESNLIAETLQEDGAYKEITSTIVLQAVRKNKSIHRSKKRLSLIIIKIVAVLSGIFTGFLFDPGGYENQKWKLFLFIPTLIITCVTTVLQFALDDKE